MTNHLLKIGLSIVFVFSVSTLFSQKDTLLLYTRPGCSNCKAAKLDLHRNNIPFFEKSIDVPENGAEAMRKIQALGFKNEIHLPVVFLNNKLRHPGVQVKDSLKPVEIDVAIDSIKSMFRRGALNLASPQANDSVISKPALESDCDVKPVTTYYLICATYVSESDAKDAMKRLIKAGYTYSGIVLSGGIYKVYNKLFYEKAAAEVALEDAKKIFREAYLQEVAQH
jgi:glutaredoxin